MAAEPPPRDTVREREVIERPAPNGGGPWGVVAAIVGAVVLVLLVWFLVVGMGGSDGDDGPSIDVPDEIQVDVDNSGPAPESDGGGDVDADADAGAEG